MGQSTQNIFRFKQFSIAQHDGVFKVGTDGCLLAATISVDGVESILDVGTGTGVIALMLAQRSKLSSIVAIDVNETAVDIARSNFVTSPWPNRLSVHHTSLNQFAGSNQRKFDLIVSNPPFFKNSIKNEGDAMALARHESELNLTGLIKTGKSLLSSHGRMALIIPTERLKELTSILAQEGLQFARLVFVKPFAHREANRVIIECCSTESEVFNETIVIYQGEKKYTDRFTGLLQAFYAGL